MRHPIIIGVLIDHNINLILLPILLAHKQKGQLPRTLKHIMKLLLFLHLLGVARSVCWLSLGLRLRLEVVAWPLSVDLIEPDIGIGVLLVFEFVDDGWVDVEAALGFGEGLQVAVFL